MKSICDLCMEFCEKYEDKQVALSGFYLDYKTLMNKILKRKFRVRNKKCRDDIIELLGQGNWEHLWESDYEKNESTEEIFKNIIGQIFYCADRWSWDRILRVNWLYLRLVDKCNSESQ